MEKPNQNLYFRRIIVSFILATIVFLFGFWASHLFASGVSEKVSDSQQEMTYEFYKLMLQKELLSDTCNIEEYDSFFSNLDEMGKYITILEKKFGKQDERVLSQKKLYSLLLTQHFLFIKDRNENCENKFPTILFFYSDKEDYSDKAKSIGYILGNLKNQDKKIMIYSFSYDLDSELIEDLKTRYNVTEPNTLIINEKEKLVNIQHIEDIKEDYLYSF